MLFIGCSATARNQPPKSLHDRAYPRGTDNRSTNFAIENTKHLRGGRMVPTLDEYRQQLEPRLPRFSPEGQRVALALNQEVTKGQALEPLAVEGLFAVRALASPRFTAFLDQKPKDRERSDTVDPPSSKDCLCT